MRRYTTLWNVGAKNGDAPELSGVERTAMQNSDIQNNCWKIFI